MITNIPTTEDFYLSGKELLDFSWDIVADLFTQLDDAQDYLVSQELEDISEAYWNSAKRRLATALSTTQQGVEFILKGRIAEISPYILIAGPPQRWPSPYESAEIKFSQFRTLDTQDLIRVYDTFSPKPMHPVFREKFNSLREKRNTIMHSVDKNLAISVLEVIDTILFVHNSLFPDESWGQVRRDFLEHAPSAELGSIDYAINRTCWELSLVFELLPPRKVKSYFGVNKSQRFYFCPCCYLNANKDVGFEFQLATLRPKGPCSSQVYCPVCDKEHVVFRESCLEENCSGNVIGQEDRICLTCGA